jgi:hypothetical protein
MEIMMAKLPKNPKISPVSDKKAEFTGFVNVTLTGDQKQAIHAWDIESEELFDALATYMQSGHKFSIVYAAQSDSFQSTVMCVNASSPNAGKVVTSYGKTPFDSLKVTIYKIHAILPPVWSELPSAMDDIG